MNYFYILFLFSILHRTLTNREILLTNPNSFHHIHCNDNLYIKINSLKYFFNKYNCKLVLNHNKTMNILCSNQSSCILKPPLFFHNRHYITKCRIIKLKSIRLNYTCVNETLVPVSIQTQSKRTIILCLCIIVVVSLLAFICSYLRHFAITDREEQKNDTHTQSIYDNQTKEEYELKNLLAIESSSSSSTSLNSKNIITNSSEYDNLIKTEQQSSLKPNDIISSRSLFKIIN